MMIETVVFEQDDGQGTMATLSLVDPRAYDGSAPPASESGEF